MGCSACGYAARRRQQALQEQQQRNGVDKSHRYKLTPRVAEQPKQGTLAPVIVPSSPPQTVAEIAAGKTAEGTKLPDAKG